MAKTTLHVEVTTHLPLTEVQQADLQNIVQAAVKALEYGELPRGNTIQKAIVSLQPAAKQV